MIDLLAHRIKTLALNRDAPFPSEIRDAHQAVREWRRMQRMRLIVTTQEEDREFCEQDNSTYVSEQK